MRLQRPLEVVTPTVDGAVVQVLASADRHFTTTQVTNLVGDHSPAGVRLVLNRLTQQGVVDLERVGRTFAYRLNRDHVAAGALIELAGLKSAVLARFRQELVTWDPPPVYASLFGSAARGDMDVRSDLDVLVVYADDADQDSVDAAVQQLQARASRWTGNDCRPVVLSSSTVREHAATDPALSRISQEGICLAGEADWLRRQVSRPRSSVARALSDLALEGLQATSAAPPEWNEFPMLPPVVGHVITDEAVEVALLDE